MGRIAGHLPFIMLGCNTGNKTWKKWTQWKKKPDMGPHGHITTNRILPTFRFDLIFPPIRNVLSAL
jgi:hypothetical protein